MNLDLDLLERLSNAPGLSGFEDEAQAVAYDALRDCSDEIWRDRLGNVIAVRRAQGGPRVPDRSGGERPVRLMYAAHVDEIGMMVGHVDDQGFVRFRAVGGLDPRSLMSQRVLIHGRNGSVKGVIATQSGWLGEAGDRDRVFPVKELYIDVGLPADEAKAAIRVGDPITFAARFERLNDRMVMGRNFDDRIGVFSLIEAMRRIEKPPVDIYAVSTVQEEVGVRGVPTAAHAIEADIAVAIDGSLPSDTPYAKPHERQCVLGEGTGIYLIDNRTIGHPALVRALFDAGEKHGIPCQPNLGGGTDASAIQRQGFGAMATTIGAPTRYMHSTVQLCHLTDIEATAALLAAFPAHAADTLPDGWR